MIATTGLGLHQRGAPDGYGKIIVGEGSKWQVHSHLLL